MKEIDQKTDVFLRKWGDIYSDLKTLFSNCIRTSRVKCVYDGVYGHLYVYYSLCVQDEIETCNGCSIYKKNP